MADQPTPESYSTLVGNMLSTYASKTGIPATFAGPARAFFETVALAVARSSGDIFQTLLNSNIAYATGAQLQAIAAEYNVNIPQTSVASGAITVTDTSFTQISTSIYPGVSAPNVGSTAIYVGNATSFPAGGGQIYIGRGTVNSEGPLTYTSWAAVGTYYVINLSTPTTKFHNIGENVLLAQGGNRTIPVNTLCVAPSNGANPNIQFSVTQSATILDGNTQVTGVPIVALLPGSSGNVAIGTINQFASVPFSGATVTNPSPTSGGTDAATDDQIRTAIQNFLSSTGLGTLTAIEDSLNGASASDDVGIISSTSSVSNSDGSIIIYIDVNSSVPYEAKTAGVAIEHIVDAAIGGEQYFQLATGGTQTSVAKAFLQSVNAAPFDLVGGEILSVKVGNVTYEHTFLATDFASPGGATSYEIAASINADTSIGFQAVTAGSGSYSVIRAIAETDDSIQVEVPSEGVNANNAIGYPTSEAETLRLYKNDVLLNKDGLVASVVSQAQSLWSSSIDTGDTLILSVDGTAFITYVFTNADFIATGLYTTVSSTNSLESWVEVMNTKMVGITAAVQGNALTIDSNLGASSRAQVIIDPSSTLVTKGMFSTITGLSATGANSDYTLNRNTAEFTLTVPLVAGDNLIAGTTATQGSAESATIPSGALSFSGPGYIWVLIDSSATLVSTGVIGNTIISVATDPSTNTVSYISATSGAFSNVLPGDYLIVWSPQLSSTNLLEARVNSITTTTNSDDTLNIVVTNAEATAATPQTGILYQNGFVVLRSTLAPQKFQVSTGVSTPTLDQVVSLLETQTDSLTFTNILEENIEIATTTLNTSGSVFIVTADTNGSLLGFTNGVLGISQPSLIAFYDTGYRLGQMPLFFHSKASADSYANPPSSFLTSFSSAIDVPLDPNNLISFLHPYGSILDEQPFGEIVQEVSLSGSAVTITSDPDVRRVRTNDRFFLASPLNFGNNDSMVVILDNNPLEETYQIPLYRNATTNTSYTVNSNNFNAYDSDYGPTGSFVSSFGADFNFDNYKVLMQAKQVLKPSPSQTAILYRSTPWGSSGEQVTVEYAYPSSPSLGITSSVSVGSTVAISISLASGSSIGTVGISGPWAVTIASNTPTSGIDQVTYTWSGSGTSPLPTLSGGEYVNISPTSGFATNNTGVFRVSTAVGYTPTADSFSVQVPTGTATPQSGITIAVNNSINFYASQSTTAAQVATYVNANLTQYVSATLVNDGGTSGAGVIVLSTYEDSGFTEQYVQLQDGVNWILTSDLSGSPQFILKKPLAYPAAGPGNAWYTFNNGEDLLFIPTTIDQVYQFINTLAVTGFTTEGTANTANRDDVLELSTDTVGSGGYIQIAGGSANGYSFPVLQSATNIDNSLMSISANQSASNFVCSGQWFQLQAANAQQKDTGFASNTDVTITPNNPSVGESLITLNEQALDQLYFGSPRSLSLSGLTFRVENQGNLVCVSYTSSNGSPQYLSGPVSFGASGGGTLNVVLVADSSDAQYVIESGTASFSGLNINDLVTISGLANSGNNGTFIVTGVSSGTLQVTNPNAVTVSSTSYLSTSFTATTGVSEGDTVIMSSPFSSVNTGSFRVIRVFNDSFWIENTNAIEEEVVLTSDSMIFYQYEATVPGDQIVISGTAFGASNAGTYTITEVIDENNVVVNSVLATASDINLNGQLSSFYVQEGVPYTGYKHVYLVSFQPGTSNQNLIVFDTYAQYEKINQSAGAVQVTSLNKLGFSLTVNEGLDSYKYNTGLIREANRITYGDPTDPLTFPGVAAAGADIFIQEPLALVINVAIDVRLQTGIPFDTIVDQVRSNVSSLISSNPVGQSIAISAIVASCMTIPGIISVAISSPNYSPTNDLIALQPSQVAFIVDPSTNIQVSLIT